MNPKTFMVIAGEPSGDLLAAELVQAVRRQVARTKTPLTWDYQPLYTSLEPRFFGAGGPGLAAAGVELAFDLTAYCVTGLSDVVRRYPQFRRLFTQLYRLALQREPDAIICVDFSGFNRRFGHAIRQYARRHHDWFHAWSPKIIQYVSPQVWASRENRVYQLAEDFDLVLSILPFERDWYQARVPRLPVEFVGHPIIDRYGPVTNQTHSRDDSVAAAPSVLLLPGSRPDELKRHLPVLSAALKRIRAELPEVRARMVLPNAALLALSKQIGLPEAVDTQVGGLAEALGGADLALASTGTVTLECAYFGVPAVALYKTSMFTWQIAKRIVTVKYAAMPNLLADEPIFPEFIQEAATPENLAKAALELLRDPPRRARVKARLSEIVVRLGRPGAATRAAEAILRLLVSPP